MPDAKGDRSKRKISKEQKAAIAAERRRQRDEETLQLRNKQIQAAETALRNAEESLGKAQSRIKRREALADHLETFYVEVDKLTKGNRHLEATTLIVEQANDIIRDAKAIVFGDAYLDRVKEFVPAGENPVYPNILIVAATVQAALKRAEPALEVEEERYRGMCGVARTIATAVHFLVDTGEQPSKSDVETAMGESPTASWFYKAEDQGVYFDIDRLDEIDLDALFAAAVKD